MENFPPDLPNLVDDEIDDTVFHEWQSPEDFIDVLTMTSGPSIGDIVITPEYAKVGPDDLIELSFKYDASESMLMSDLHKQSLLDRKEYVVVNVLQCIGQILRKQMEIFPLHSFASNGGIPVATDHIVHNTLESLYLRGKFGEFREYLLKIINYPILEMNKAFEIAHNRFLPKDQITLYFCWINTIFFNHNLDQLQFIVRH